MATPYMGLDLPTPTVTAGPAYASQNNAAFTVVDAHDHTPGKGAPVPTAGLVINADLPFGAFNAVGLRSSRMENNVAPIADPADLICMHASAGNLYWNNESGQQIQLTAGGALNAASVGGIGGDYSTSSASVFYTTATTKFTFWQGANIAAFMDQGATTIRDTGASANGVTLVAPSGLANSYQLTFPSALPGATKIMTIGSTGNIGAVYDTDNVTTEISGSVIQLKDGGVSTAKLATSSVTIAKLAPLNYALSSSSGTYSSSAQTLTDVTNLTVTFTTTGRPVFLMLQADGTGGGGTPSSIGWSSGTGATGIYIDILRDGSSICFMQLGAPAPNYQFLPGMVKFLDTGATAGSHTWKIQCRSVGSGVVHAFTYLKLVAYEKA